MSNKNSELPHNKFLEQFIIGCLLTQNNLYDKISTILTRDDFYDELHKKIYSIIAHRLELGELVDPIILAHIINEDENQYVLEIIEQNFIDMHHIEEYAQLIKKMSLKRKLLFIGSKILSNPENAIDVYDEIRWCENEVFNIYKSTASGITISFFEGAKSFLNFTKQLMLNKVDIIGVPSGFNGLDTITGGFKPGELIILAARPSMGKTALCVNMLTNAAKKKFKVLFLSLEMPYDQICARIISYVTEIPLYNLLQAKISPQVFHNCMMDVDRLNDLPIIIHDNSFITVSGIRSLVRQYKRQENISLVVVDYLQLIDSNKQESREQEISKISRSLKLIAKEMGVAMLVLSQMSRDIEKRKDGDVPKLADLRGSGSIEQDADVVLFLYRKNPEDTENVILNIAKNRNGALGDVQLIFTKEIASFASDYKQKTNNTYNK